MQGEEIAEEDLQKAQEQAQAIEKDEKHLCINEC